MAQYDKAIGYFERLSPEDLADAPGQYGKTFASMGVSYWEVGQEKKALVLSEKGIAWMEQAVKQGSLKASALTIPYDNLSAMHRKLGAADKANRFHEMAGRVKQETLK